MAILLTGSSGFLGHQLLNRLIEEGREVVAVSRRSLENKSLRSHSKLYWCEQDIAAEGISLKGMPDIETVVHLAGATLGAEHDEPQFLYANEMTTVRMLQSLAGRVERFIFASSQVVYGDVGQLNVNEEFPLSPDGSAYACSKLNSENWIHWFHKQHGGQYLILRFCGFIDGGGLVDYLIERALKGEIIELYSNGAVRRDYLPTSAAIDVLVSALDFHKNNEVIPVNIGSGQAYSALELAKLVCEELASTSEINLLEDPAPQGDFIFNIERARRLFGFEPECLGDVVRQYVGACANKYDN